MLIFDRKASDVDEARRLIAKKQSPGGLSESEEKAYNAGLRGCYSYTDWNRVEAKVLEIANWLNSLGYYVNVVTKTNWTAQELISRADVERYLANIRTIREAYIQLSTSPLAPDISRWIDYTAANDIERILFDTEASIQSSVTYAPRCGTIISGGARLRYKRASNQSEEPDVEIIDRGTVLEIKSDSITAYGEGTTLYINAPRGTITMI